MRITKRLTLLVALSLLPVSSAFSQSDGQSDGASHENTFDIDFPGGSVTDLIASLSELPVKFPNIIVPDSASFVNIPRLTLRNVTLTDLTSVLNEIGKTGSDSEQFALTRTTDNVWAVVTPKADAKRSQQQALFFPISKHIESHSIQDVSTTISTAWKMLDLPGDAASHIMFHEDTEILIATGTKEMLEVVSGALEALAADGQSKIEKELETQLENALRKLESAETNANVAAQINQERSKVIQDDLRRNLDELREENAKLRDQLRDLESALARANRAK